MEDDSPSKPRLRLAEAFERVWSQALVAASAAEEEVARALARVAEGASWSPEDLRKHIQEFGQRLSSQRLELERSIEEGIRKALGRLRGNGQEEWRALEARINRLSRRVDLLAARKPLNRK